MVITSAHCLDSSSLSAFFGMFNACLPNAEKTMSRRIGSTVPYPRYLDYNGRPERQEGAIHPIRTVQLFLINSKFQTMTSVWYEKRGGMKTKID